MNTILNTYDHSHKARADFKKAFKIWSDNPFTPDHIKTFYINDYAVELTTGEGSSGNTVYGVTVVDTFKNENIVELGKCLHSLKQVQEYLDHLNCQKK